MTKEMILDLISQGEGVTIEFKECKNEVASEVYPTVCSFSNRFGGHILMGVSDNGEIIGVNPNTVKGMRKNFSNMLNNPRKSPPRFIFLPRKLRLTAKSFSMCMCREVPRSTPATRSLMIALVMLLSISAITPHRCPSCICESRLISPRRRYFPISPSTILICR